MASDGVFDNIYDNQIEDCLLQNLAGVELFDLESASQCISKLALMFGYNRNFVSPFAAHAKQHKMQYNGGKDDDIVAIVAQIHTKKQGYENS
mgnify:CR=1 FL=1